jgi:hypothetical protein
MQAGSSPRRSDACGSGSGRSRSSGNGRGRCRCRCSLLDSSHGRNRTLRRYRRHSISAATSGRRSGGGIQIATRSERTTTQSSRQPSSCYGRCSGAGRRRFLRRRQRRGVATFLDHSLEVERLDDLVLRRIHMGRHACHRPRIVPQTSHEVQEVTRLHFLGAELGALLRQGREQSPVVR